MAIVLLRVPASLLIVSLLLLQVVQTSGLCCAKEGHHEAHLRAADDAGTSSLQVCPSHGEQHDEDHECCSCVCHATVAAVTSAIALGDATVDRLLHVQPQMVLALGHLLTSKPPPRA